MKRFLLSTYLWVLLLPYAAAGVGIASNQVVLIANHDTFPVLMREPQASKLLPDEEGHVRMTQETHFNALGDILDFHSGWESVGDQFLELADWLHSFCPYVWLALVIRKIRESDPCILS